MNQQVLLDILSEFLMVEHGGVQLYEVASTATARDDLRKRYQEFGGETRRHRTILTRLIEDLGGDPNYISPTARLAQQKAAGLLESSIRVNALSPEEFEAHLLENVLLAETKDQADWDTLAQMTEQLVDENVRAAIKQAVDEVGPDEHEHLDWARITLAQLVIEMAQADTPPSPARWIAQWSATEASIADVHPAPLVGHGQFDHASHAPWQDAPAVRAEKSAAS